MTSEAAHDQGWRDPAELRRQDDERARELAELKAQLEEPDTGARLTMDEIRAMREQARKAKRETR